MPGAIRWLIIIFLFSGIFSSSLQASYLYIGLSGGLFYPSEEVFREIYSSGAQFGGELVYTFWYNYGLFLRGSYFQRDGQLSFTKDKTTVKILPLIIGFRYHVTGRRVSGFLDLGLGLFHFDEKNPLGQATVNKLGYAISSGLNIFIYQGFYLGGRLDYTYCQVKPFELAAQIGGLNLGLNIGYRFQLTPEEETWVWREVKEEGKYHP